MKSTHEPFDKELRERLLNFKEEPDNVLWKGIVSRIVSVNPPPAWTVWSARLSVFICLFSVMTLFYSDQHASIEDIIPAPGQIISGAADSRMTTIPKAREPDDIEAGESIRLEKRPRVVHEQSHATHGGSHLAYLPTWTSPEKDVPSDVYEFPADISISSSDVPELSFRDFEAPSDAFNDGHALPQTEGSVARIALLPSAVTKGVAQKGDDVLSTADSTLNKKSSEPEVRRKTHIPLSLYFTAMPTFGYQRIQSNNYDRILIENIKRVPAFSFDRLGVRLEAGAGIYLSKRWKAFGGVLYFQRKQTIEYTEKQVDSLTIGSGPDGVVTIDPRFDYLNKSFEYELRNVGLQLGFTYQLSTANKNSGVNEALSLDDESNSVKKISHVLGTGIEFHKALKKIRAFDNAEGFSDPSAYVFFNLYYRLQYPSTGKLRAILQPTLNYAFYINEDLNAPFYVKPYGLGLNFGCIYHFK